MDWLLNSSKQEWGRARQRGQRAEQSINTIYRNKRIWKGRTIWVRYSMWCPSHQVHPLAEQALRKMDVSPCTSHLLLQCPVSFWGNSTAHFTAYFNNNILETFTKHNIHKYSIHVVHLRVLCLFFYLKRALCRDLESLTIMLCRCYMILDCSSYVWLNKCSHMSGSNCMYACPGETFASFQCNSHHLVLLWIYSFF